MFIFRVGWIINSLLFLLYLPFGYFCLNPCMQKRPLDYFLIKNSNIPRQMSQNRFFSQTFSIFSLEWMLVRRAFRANFFAPAIILRLGIFEFLCLFQGLVNISTRHWKLFEGHLERGGCSVRGQLRTELLPDCVSWFCQSSQFPSKAAKAPERPTFKWNLDLKDQTEIIGYQKNH